jgi:glycosyltransferase involved in cell wall biosynthesis
MDDRTASEAILREEEGYRNATGVLTHSHWAARSVVEEYGASANVVHVAVAGASFDATTYSEWDGTTKATQQTADSEPLRLVFVGKYSQRKGLDRLLAAVHIARARGASIVLRVIGLEKADSPIQWRNEPGIEWYGFLDKRTEPRRFLHAVAENDLGCLLSRAEAGGIVLREFHALGLPVIGPAVGGSPEHMFSDASIQVAPETSDDAIAEILVHLCNDRPALARLREHAWNRRYEALWDSTVTKILKFLPSKVRQTTVSH